MSENDSLNFDDTSAVDVESRQDQKEMPRRGRPGKKKARSSMTSTNCTLESTDCQPIEVPIHSQDKSDVSDSTPAPETECPSNEHDSNGDVPSTAAALESAPDPFDLND